MTPGPLKRIFELAGRLLPPGKPFVLVIDEINRANIAEGLRGLYFLLEYRGAEVSTAVQRGGGSRCRRTCSSSAR